MYCIIIPFRNKPLKFKGGDSQDGLITPPQSYDQLSLDERRSAQYNTDQFSYPDPLVQAATDYNLWGGRSREL